MLYLYKVVTISHGMTLDEKAAAEFLECIKKNQAARLVASIASREFVIGTCIGDHDRTSQASKKTRAKVGIAKEWRGYAPPATIYYIDPVRMIMLTADGKLSDVGFSAMRIPDAKRIQYNGEPAELPVYLEKHFRLVQQKDY